MYEIVTEAIVLDRETVGENSGRIWLYTRELGRVVARAQALFKTNSKLSAYLQPTRYVQVRVVERKGINIADALNVPGKEFAPNLSPKQRIDICQLIRRQAPELSPDEKLWGILTGPEVSIRSILSDLGFDPAHSSCSICGKGKPTHFILKTATFVCDECFSHPTNKGSLSVGGYAHA